MVAGALAGLAGSAFRITLARAEQMRDALAEWRTSGRNGVG
jgi:hypothetical protein